LKTFVMKYYDLPSSPNARRVRIFMANWVWIRSHRWARVPTEGLEHLERWMAAMAAQPGCQRGVEVPPPTRSAAETKRGGRAITTL
jgi:glutathione S-transferase